MLFQVGQEVHKGLILLRKIAVNLDPVQLLQNILYEEKRYVKLPGLKFMISHYEPCLECLNN